MTAYRKNRFTIPLFPMLPRLAMMKVVLVNIACLVMTVRSSAGAERSTGRSEWSVGAAVGVVDFVSPNRSASTISHATLGGAVSLFVLQRPLSFFAVGCGAEIQYVPSGEPDANATLGGRGTLMLRFILPLKKLELHLTPEAGYGYLGRNVDFDNTDRVSFHGATVGLAVGADVPISERLAIGGTVRVSHILGGLTCTRDRCHVPQKGRSPGPALLFGVTGSFTTPQH